MEFFAIQTVRQALKDPQLQIYADPAWGSENAAHRTLMHEKVDQLKSQGYPHTSISHCAGMGIILASRYPVGVDVEQSARITEAVVQRVSTKEEYEAAPSAASLWCAKEACFKALKAFTQPSVISNISIGAWEKLESQHETCHLTNSQKFNAPFENDGIFISSPPHSFCFFIFRT